MSAPGHPARPHIVVLGAGFGGLTFAKKFPSGLARLTVIDRQNHHLFQPLLYQVAAAGLAAPDIAQPIRSILRDQPDVTVLMTEARAVDLATRTVTLDHGALTYDYLIFAPGGLTSYFGHPEWERHAPGLKTIDDALRIRRQVLLAFERAETETDAARREQLMTIVIVGGGPTGVELAGTFAELARVVLRRDFEHIDPARARVILVEGGPRVLPAFPETLSASARRQLTQLGVGVRTGTLVKAIREGEVELAAETIRTANIIWAAGVAASPLTRSLGVETDRAGRLKVAPDLSLPGHPEVFALGDSVNLVDRNGVAVPGIAPAAMQMGAHAAKLVASAIRNDSRNAPRAAFVYWDKGTMATIGRSAAVAQIGRLRFSGWPAWAAWLGVHLIFLIGFRNRLSVFLQWVYSYWTYRRGARLITGLEERR
ncbi:MAG: NAD(P)/FAD-dependent oxidoreductase [Opitutaceae bacterium]|nr:NAD(P)/FAD-dependent oxidoreductase [Opitutaceae bacterium]